MSNTLTDIIFTLYGVANTLILVYSAYSEIFQASYYTLCNADCLRWSAVEAVHAHAEADNFTSEVVAVVGKPGHVPVAQMDSAGYPQS